jgi:hypothetical protein
MNMNKHEFVDSTQFNRKLLALPGNSWERTAARMFVVAPSPQHSCIR